MESANLIGIGPESGQRSLATKAMAAITFGALAIVAIGTLTSGPPINNISQYFSPTADLYTLAQKIVPWDSDHGYTIGAAMNSLTGESLSQQCITNLKVADSQTGNNADGGRYSYSFKEITSQADMASTLDVTASGSYSGFGASASTSASFSRHSTYSQFKATYVLKITASLTNSQLDTSVGQTAFNTAANSKLSVEEFYQTCGDSFIYGATRGGAFYAVLTMDNADKESSTAVGASVTGEGWGAKFSTEMKSTTSNALKTGSLNIEISMIGGTGNGFSKSLGRDLDSLLSMAEKFASEVDKNPVPYKAILKPWTHFRGFVTSPLNKNMPQESTETYNTVVRLNAAYQMLNQYANEMSQVRGMLSKQPRWSQTAVQALNVQPYAANMCADNGCTDFVTYQINAAKNQLATLFGTIVKGGTVSSTSTSWATIDMGNQECFSNIMTGIRKLVACAEMNSAAAPAPPPQWVNSKYCGGRRRRHRDQCPKQNCGGRRRRGVDKCKKDELLYEPTIQDKRSIFGSAALDLKPLNDAQPINAYPKVTFSVCLLQKKDYASFCSAS